MTAYRAFGEDHYYGIYQVIYGYITRMDARTYLQLCVGFMGDLESVADTDKIESHAGYLSRMIDAVFLRDPRNHHVWSIINYLAK